MADTKVIVAFQAKMEQLRKGYADVAKLQEKFVKQSKTHTKASGKAAKDEITNLQKLNRARKEELTHLQKVVKLQTDANKQQAISVKHQRRTGIGARVWGQGSGKFFSGEDRTSRAQIGTGGAKVAGLGGAVAGGFLSLLIGAIQAGYQRHMAVQAARGPLVGLSGTVGGKSPQLQGIKNRMGSKLGFNVLESQQMMPGMAKATGVTGVREMEQAVRATGIDAGEVGDYFKTIRAGGTSFAGPNGAIQGVGKGQGNSKGGEEFKKWISLGMQSGIERARLPEFFGGIQNLLQKQLAVSSGDVSGVGYAKTLALFGASGKSGFQRDWR